MLQERIYAYEGSLSVKDKGAYVKAARMCAEYFDGRCIEHPTADNWSDFAEYVREEYVKENGQEPTERTVKNNYIGRGKKFIAYCESGGQSDGQTHTQSELFTSGQGEAPVNVTERMERVNFMLDASRYEVLLLLRVMEHKSMTAIMAEAVDLYIREHAEQAGILSAAMEQARSKNS